MSVEPGMTHYRLRGGLEPRDGDFRLPTTRGLLSAAEIEMLLRPDIPKDAFEEPACIAERPIEEMSVDQSGPSLGIHAEALASRLTLVMRKACGMDAVFRTSAARRGALRSVPAEVPGGKMMILFDGPDAEVSGLLVLSASLAEALIDRACGGRLRAGASEDADEGARPFTALDHMLVESVLAPLAGALDPAFTVSHIETDSLAADAILPPGDGLIATLSATVAGRDGRAVFACREIVREVSGASTRPGQLHATLTARLASLDVPVSRLSDLKPGSVLLLGVPTDQPVSLLSGGRSGALAAEGEIGRKGNRIAVRITRLTGLVSR